MPFGWWIKKGLYWPPWPSWLSRNPWPAWEERRTWWSRTTWYSWLPWSKSEILVSLLHNFISLLEKKIQAILHEKAIKSRISLSLCHFNSFQIAIYKILKAKFARMEVKIRYFGKSKRYPHNPKPTFHFKNAVSAEPFQAAAVLIWPSRRVTIPVVTSGCC